MKPKVKSCPFCGGTLMELKPIELWKPRETKFIMRCCACRAQTGIKETEEEAIVVKYVGRGHWGEKVFATREEAEAAINKKEKENEVPKHE